MRDLTGIKYGKWVVSGFAYKTPKSVYWQCRCECGTVKNVRDSTLLNGESSGCGVGKCNHSYKHGNKKTRAYLAWQGMLNRCNNTRTKEFHRYGGRGIVVCDRWKQFVNFLEDMGEPAKGLTLDRKESDGNYEPSNCRWATRLEQGGNTCRVKKVTYQGETRSVRNWATVKNIHYKTLLQRIHLGWDLDLAFDASYDGRGKHGSSSLATKL